MVFHKRMTRASALLQTALGVTGIAFGVVDIMVVKSMKFYIGIPIWLGAWVIFTGSLGIILTANKYPARKQWLLGSFLGFSLASSALAGFVAYLYIPLVIDYAQHRSETRLSATTSILVCSVIALLCVAEVVFGILSAVCCSRGCYFCGGSPRALDVSTHEAYLGMATQYAMASGSHVLVEVPGAPPAIVPVQIVNDLDTTDTTLSHNEILY